MLEGRKEEGMKSKKAATDIYICICMRLCVCVYIYIICIYNNIIYNIYI
jgi:hypothetical protein